MQVIAGILSASCLTTAVVSTGEDRNSDPFFS